MSLSDSLDDSLQNLHRQSELQALEQEFESRHPWNKSSSSKKVNSSSGSIQNKSPIHKRFLTEVFNEDENPIYQEEDDEEQQSVRYFDLLRPSDQQTKQCESQQNTPLYAKTSFNSQIQPTFAPRNEDNVNSQYFSICNQKLLSSQNKNSILKSYVSSPQKPLWSQSSNKLTYSSDKKSLDRQPTKQDKYISFGQTSNLKINDENDFQLKRIHDLSQESQSVDQMLNTAKLSLQNEDYTYTLKILEKTEKLPHMNDNQRISLNYLYAQAFYAIQRWKEFQYSADQVVELVFSLTRNTSNIYMDKEIDILLHCLQMLVTGYLKQTLFEDALKNQAMLVELANGRGQGNVEQHIILAEIHKKLGRYQDAYQAFLKTQSLLCDSEQFKLIYQNLFLLSQEMGKDQDCVKFGEELLNLVDDQESINVYQIMVKIYHSQQKPKETIRCLTQLLKQQIEFNGYNNQQTCSTMMNLAKLELDQGLYKQAYDGFKKSAFILGQLQGTQNIQYAGCQLNMGIASFFQKEYQKSFEHYSQVYTLYEKFYGSTHDHTLRIQLNQIQILAKQSLIEQTEHLYSEIIVKLESLPDKQKQVQLGHELGLILSKQKLYNTALDAYYMTLQFMESMDQNKEIQKKKCLLLQTLGSIHLFINQTQQSLNCYRDAKLIALVLEDNKILAELEQQIRNCQKHEALNKRVQQKVQVNSTSRIKPQHGLKQSSTNEKIKRFQ